MMFKRIVGWSIVCTVVCMLTACTGWFNFDQSPEPIPEPGEPVVIEPITGPEPILGPDPVIEPEPPFDPDASHTGPRQHQFTARDTGAVELRTFDMVPPERAGGELENFVLTLRGDGIKRMAIVNMANNNKVRSIRLLMQSRAGTWDKKNAHDNNLPGWHVWRIEWEPGESRVYLDGALIGKGKHRGSPDEAWAGTWDGERWWPGVWSSLRVYP